MYAHTSDRFLALWLWKFGLLENYMANTLQSLCMPGMHIVDVGANIGFYTLLFSRLTGGSGKVWAFEPGPKNLFTLQKNIAANACTNIIVVDGGVSNFSSEGRLYLSEHHHGDHRIFQDGARQSIPIKLYSLDEYFTQSERIDLIKLDIQGSEGLALKGMRRILAENTGLIVVFEFWPIGLSKLGIDPARLLLDLFELNYRIQVIDERAKQLHDLEAPGLKVFIRNLEASGVHTNLIATSL